MIIAIDVGGFENSIEEPINAAIQYCKNHIDINFIFCGQQEKIEPLIKNYSNFSIENATDVIAMTDEPLTVLRKKESSMYKSIMLVANGKADGVISAANSGAYIFGCFSLLKTIEGISKPAFLSFYPTALEKPMLFLDTGANKKCEGEDLYSFAFMGDIYAKKMFNIKKPTIAVINIGTEKNKGFDYHQKADELISADASLNYQGFIEPRYILTGETDICVCDGYTGNIVTKTAEGVMKTLMSSIKTEFKRPLNLLGAILSIRVFKSLKKK
ncbi:phosphate acyltransferase [Bacilli bacterium]|nr:phosphate acyltransferase [Bacilli bacterium]